MLGEDPRYLGSDLERHGPGMNGWRSGKGQAFPQELILQLESRSRLGHMQLLAHQYVIRETCKLYVAETLLTTHSLCILTSKNMISIAEAIELFIGECIDSGDGVEDQSKIDLNRVHFIHLGRVTMSTNQSTGFKARELKSITVSQLL